MKNILIVLFLINSAFATDKILFLGDSLTAGYGLEKDFSYPSIIEKILIKEGRDIKCLNGGVSGSTTASGVSRLRWFLKAKPTIMVLALGANDGLRGVKVKQSQINLDKIILKAKEHKIKILLAGMKLPTNYGEDYRQEFEQMYRALQKKHKLTLIPFILDQVGGVEKLNQEDGIHPNESGQKIVARTVLKYLRPLL